MTRPQVWRDRDGDFWSFGPDGEAWILGWTPDHLLGHGAVEQRWGPLALVDLPVGAPRPPLGAS